MAFHMSRWNPFHDVARIDPFRNVDSMLKEFNLSPMWSGLDAEPRIRMDVSEDETSYLVKAEIPGVRKEDIKISIVGNQVSISAETVKEKEEKKGETLLRSERYYGQQYRSFALSNDVDESKAEAKYRDGILELKLPKKTGASVRHLPVD